MNKIVLDEVLPQVFASAEHPASGLWERKIEFERGKYYCVNAGSGVGKTSLCSFLTGLRHDYIGTIKFDDADIADFDINKWCDVRKTSLAYLPQELDVFNELTAYENVMLKNKLTDFKSEKEIAGMFELLELEHKMHSVTGRLSVGQKQRVALIRALCQPFDFVILDEPVSHLDLHNNELCGQLVVDTASKLGAGVVFTSVGNPLIVKVPFIPVNM